jgi:AP-2 complex subunit mu-1
VVRFFQILSLQEDESHFERMFHIGTILRADVDGQILMRAYLTGTPECKFGLNDKLVLDKSTKPRSEVPGLADSAPEGAVELDDCQFHQCVRLGKFEQDRTISFVPPDGEFELMRYAYVSCCC